MLLCSNVIFLLRDEWMTERFSQAMGAALVCNNFSQIPSKISFHMKQKSDWLQPEIYKALKPGWLLNWVSIACRYQQRLLQTRKRHVFVLARQTSTSKAGERPQELGRWFFPLNFWLLSGTAFGEIARWPAGAWTWTQTWTVSPDQWVVQVYSLLYHSINCVEFQIFF